MMQDVIRTLKPALLPAVLVLVALFAYGWQLDQNPNVDQQTLFMAIHVSGLVGLVFASVLLLPTLPDTARKALYVIGIVVAWRIAYFPFMVFSGHGASIVEWALEKVSFIPPFIFPAFLVQEALFNAVVATIVWFILRPQTPKWVYGVIAGPAIFASMISFTTPYDVKQPLPDELWSSQRPVPPVVLPYDNPYFPKLQQTTYTLPQRALLFAAGNAYDLIPESPWARVVKGTLEELANQNPVATSADRVAEHYQAYMAAHRFIGCRLNDSRSRCQLPPTAKKSPHQTVRFFW